MLRNREREVLPDTAAAAAAAAGKSGGRVSARRRFVRPLSCFHAERSDSEEDGTTGSGPGAGGGGPGRPHGNGRLTAGGGATGGRQTETSVSMMAGLMKRFSEDPYVLADGWSWKGGSGSGGGGRGSAAMTPPAAPKSSPAVAASGGGGGDAETNSSGDCGGGRTETRSFCLTRRGNSSSFGFTLVGSQPVRVGKVEPGSVASAAGVRSGDIVVAINGETVLSCSCDTVVTCIRRSGERLDLRIQRWLTDGPAPTTAAATVAAAATAAAGTSSTVPARGNPAAVSSAASCQNLAYDSMIAEPPPRLPPQSQPPPPPPPPPPHSPHWQRLHQRQAAAAAILAREAAYVEALSAGQRFYKRRLSRCLGPQVCAAVFHRLDRLLDTSRQLLRQLERCQPPEASLGQVYRSRVFQLCDDYREFGDHLRDACPRAIRGLHACPDFLEVLRDATQRPDLPSLNACLTKPVCHLRALAAEFQTLLATIPEDDPDHLFADDVAQALDHCAQLMPNPNSLKLPTPPTTPQATFQHQRQQQLELQHQLPVFSGDLVLRDSNLGDSPVHAVLLPDRLRLTRRCGGSGFAETHLLADCQEASFDLPHLLMRLGFWEAGRRVSLQLEAPSWPLKTLWRGFFRQRLDAVANAADGGDAAARDAEGYADGVLIA